MVRNLIAFIIPICFAILIAASPTPRSEYLSYDCEISFKCKATEGHHSAESSDTWTTCAYPPTISEIKNVDDPCGCGGQANCYESIKTCWSEFELTFDIYAGCSAKLDDTECAPGSESSTSEVIMTLKVVGCDNEDEQWIKIWGNNNCSGAWGWIVYYAVDCSALNPCASETCPPQ